jgi:DNA-binding NtrC family response regulator
VGGTEPIPVNVRLIAATHRDLKALIADDRFREDLYYRLAVVTIELPRLAVRGDDLLLLTTRFLAEFGTRQGKTFTGITHQALELLAAHEWAGNVRELRNVIERAVLIADGAVLKSEHLPEKWRTRAALEPALDRPQLMTLEALESRQIAFTLDFTHGHVGEAATLLGVHRNTLSRKIKEYGL